jgi:hypothetical protein
VQSTSVCLVSSSSSQRIQTVSSSSVNMGGAASVIQQPGPQGFVLIQNNLSMATTQLNELSLLRFVSFLDPLHSFFLRLDRESKDAAVFLATESKSMW